MIQYYWPVFIVGLPIVNTLDFTINKLDYTTPIADCQIEKQQNTLEYNYIKSQDYIQDLIDKYDKLLP